MVSGGRGEAQSTGNISAPGLRSSIQRLNSGQLLPLLNQLSQLLIYTYVFSIVLKVKLNLAGFPENSDITFGVWLFAGLLPWSAFTSGLIKSGVSVVGQPNLVKKVVFPLGLLPLVPILTAFIESSLGLAALIVIVAVSSHKLNATLCLLPLVGCLSC